MTDTETPRLKPLLGLVLCRLVVPAWILTGALFKMVESNPALLPEGIRNDGYRLGIDLDVLLATLISIEILVALVIVFVGRIARPAAIFMTAVFCAVLIREIAMGNTSCGCLGTSSPSPWTMLFVDGAMLVGLILLKPGRIPAFDGAKWPAAAAVVLALAGAGTTFAAVLPRTPDPAPGPTAPDGGQAMASPDEAGTDGDPDPRAGTPAAPAGRPRKALPSYWYKPTDEFPQWVGQRWQDVELFQFMDELPSGLDEGLRYVVFYNRTCDHCEEMFNLDFVPYPDLARQVTAVEVPASTDRLTDPDGWPLPPTECELMSLPLGPNWIMTTPVALRIEDGIVQCAAEGDHFECLGITHREHDHEH